MSYLRIKVGKETHKRSVGIYYEVEVRLENFRPQWNAFMKFVSSGCGAVGWAVASDISGQSFKASTLVNYDSRVVSLSNLLVITTLES